jgi:hypothetical protein
MRAGIIKRLSVLEKAHKASHNEQGQTLAEVLRERFCRIDAELTGRPLEELIANHANTPLRSGPLTQAIVR